jgi:hypothetical protein
MPQFPHSKYSASPAAGVLVKHQGSHSPMVEGNDYDKLAPPIPDHPFKIKFKKVDNVWKFYVVPGSVNNKVPTLKEVSSLDAVPAPMENVPSSAQDVYIICPYVEDQPFPKDPDIDLDTSTPENTDSNAYIKIGRIQLVDGKPVKLSQTVMTSLWIERLKCGSGSAEYYVSRS